jgi:uncharacterized protein
MNCPKCASELERMAFHGIAFDRCMQCKGIWFNHTAHKSMKKIHGSQSIDIGSEAEGHKLDGVKASPCPVCRQAMDSVRDTFQPHIRYETCPYGDGVFFDAGEFRDFKEESLGDFVKSLTWYFRKHDGSR